MTSCRQLEARRLQVGGALDQRLEPVLPSRVTASLVRSWLRASRSAVIDVAAGGVQLGGELQLDQRLFVACRCRRGAGRARSGPAAARSLARCSDSASSGRRVRPAAPSCTRRRRGRSPRAARPAWPALKLEVDAQPASRRPAARPRPRRRRGAGRLSPARQHPPPGIVKANFASARPTFSRRWVKRTSTCRPGRRGDQHAQPRSRDRRRASGDRIGHAASSAPAPARRCRRGLPRRRRAATA